MHNPELPTLEQLRKMAAEKKIAGRSGMDKAQLMASLEASPAPLTHPAGPNNRR